MFIQTEPTPNPASLKFLPGERVMPSGTAEFRDPESAAVSPLGRRLFQIDGVMGVYLGADFITITKAEGTEWHYLKPAILGTVMEHFTAGLPMIDADQDAGSAAPALGPAAGADANGADGEIITQIMELLDTRVRPAVAMDGGDIVFHGYDNGIVYLFMQGACQGCPSASFTLKHGIENLLRHYIPEVREVRAI